MKNIKYIILLLISIGFMSSCGDLFDDETELDLNDDTPNVVTFEKLVDNLTMTATGEEMTMSIPIKIVGPTVADLTSDITVTFSEADGTTAIEGQHYRFVNDTLILKKSNNYLGLLDIVLMSEGNAAPMDGTPEFDEYVPPMLYLKINATGADNVEGSGKIGQFTLNFIPPNPYEGDYVAHIIYRHPSMGDYPDNIMVEEDNDKKLVAITGRKCETWFAVWPSVPCQITVNADNSIAYVVDDSWGADVKLGDPYDPTLISHYDPADGKIYLYYSYYLGPEDTSSPGDRVFWEVFTPQF